LRGEDLSAGPARALPDIVRNFQNFLQQAASGGPPDSTSSIP